MSLTDEQIHVMDDLIRAVADSSYFVGDWRRGSDCESPGAEVQNLFDRARDNQQALRDFILQVTGTPNPTKAKVER